MSAARAGSATHTNVLRLYHRTLRAASQFADANYRSYALRTARGRFRANASESDPKKIDTLYNRGVKDLGVLERQAMISQMYFRGQSILDVKEQQKAPSSS